MSERPRQAAPPVVASASASAGEKAVGSSARWRAR